MAEVPEVSARRLGKEQRFELSAAGDGRRWFAVQWAAKPRPSRQELAPWWYEQGRTWHLYREEPEPGEPLPPPMASFAQIGDVKAHVAAVVAKGRAGQ